MKTDRRPLLLLLAASFAISATISACGGDGGAKPKVRSFTASPATVPSLGGDVQLVWDVSKAEEISIEPLVGVVTGSSAMVHVTETTEFTLTAKRNGRAARKRATVTVAGPSAVTGMVRTALGRQPRPDLVVWIKGQGSTFSAADGTFSFENIETPYDIAVVDATNPNGPLAVVYLGVTRQDPVLEIDEVDFNFARFAAVSGTITPAAPPGTQTAVNVDTTGFLPLGFDASAGTYDASADWLHSDTDDITLHAVRWAVDSTGRITSYTGFAQEDLTVTDNVAAVADITLDAVSTDETTGTVSLPGTAELVDVQGFYLFGVPTGTFADKGFFLPSDPFAIGPGGNEFTLLSPEIGDGLHARFTVAGPGGTSRTYLPIAPGSSGNEIALGAPPRLLVPGNESTVSRDTVLRAATREDSVKVFVLKSASIFSSYGMVVITTDSEFVIPDLREIGMDLFTQDAINWDLRWEIAPRSSVDEAVGPDGMSGLSPESLGSTDVFTLYPQDDSQ